MIHLVKYETDKYTKDTDPWGIDHYISNSDRDMTRPLKIGDRVLTDNWCYELTDIDYSHKKPFYLWNKRRITLKEWKPYKNILSGRAFENCVYEKVSEPIKEKSTTIVKRGRKGRI